MMQIALSIMGLLFAAFIGVVVVARFKLKNMPPVADHEKVITLTDKNFAVQTKNRVVLVDFWAAWCGPCKMMAPVLNHVAEELTDNRFVGKVNVEEQKGLAQKFGIRSIPTLILFKNGKEVNRFVGVKSKDYLLQQIEKV